MLLLVLGIAPLLIWLLFPSDEARIKRLIKESAGAVEIEDIDVVMGHVSFSYRDDYGQSYMLLKRNLLRQFEMYSDIQVEYEDLAVEVRKDGATASLSLLVLATLGGQRGYILGDLKEAARLVVGLRKSPAKKWLIIKASIDPAP